MIKIDELIRCRRKSIALIITPDARLVVRAPLSTPEDFIYKLIHQKRSWITRKQALSKERVLKTKVRQFAPGEEFLFLGQAYPLTVVEDLPKAVVFDGALKISQAVLNNAKDHLELWYKTQASGHISERVDHYAKLAGLRYCCVRVNNAKTRWGSCGYTDKLNFTWRLIMAPPRVIDYVVIHELMHLKQRNHSRKFWDEVARMIPDYPQDEQWLKENGGLLIW